MLKKDSKAWKLASKRAKRKAVMSYPVELFENGDVLLCSKIRGNTWRATFSELELLEQNRK